MKARFRAGTMASLATVFTLGVATRAAAMLSLGTSGVASTGQGLPFTESDPSFYASPDPLSRSVLTNQSTVPSDKGASAASRELRRSSKKGSTAVTPDRIPEELRDAPNETPQDKALSPVNVAVIDAESSAKAEEPLPGRPAVSPKAQEQLNQISRRIRITCGVGADQDCGDRLWGEQPSQPAQERDGRPKRSEK